MGTPTKLNTETPRAKTDQARYDGRCDQVEGAAGGVRVRKAREG